MVKNSPCDADNTGSILGHGTKIPHPAEQISWNFTARESEHNKERLHGLQLRPKATK